MSFRKKLSAKLLSINTINPSVRHYTFHVGNDFEFFPGQWIDLYLPLHVQNSLTNLPKDKEILTGFSMICSPSFTKKSSTIQLAIKASDHPVTNWLSTIPIDAPTKSEIFATIDGGQGNFYFRKEEFPNTKHIFLIAGGVGVTPLLSMIQYIHEDIDGIEASLLYSSKRAEDFVMLEELKQLSKQNGKLKCYFTQTGESASDNKEIKFGRINEQLLQESVENAKIDVNKEAIFYISGPGDFLDAMADLIVKKFPQIAKENVRYEKW